MSKVALITGVATGMGRESAVRLAEDGFDLILADWNAEKGEETTVLCREKGVQADFVHTDMGNEAHVEKIIHVLKEKHNHLDFYLNNQGVINNPKLFYETTEEEVDYLLHTNFKGCFFGLKHVSKYMVEQNSGHIVVVASSSGIRPETGFGVYSATKHGAIGLAKDAAMELASSNVRVNTICPGGFVTPLTQKVEKYMTETNFVQPVSSQPLLSKGALGQTSQMAPLVSFMASEGASYMTGSIISVDGGITL